MHLWNSLRSAASKDQQCASRMLRLLNVDCHIVANLVGD